MGKKVKIDGKGIVNTISVEIGEETYSVPLAGSMKRKDLAAMRKAAESGNDLAADDALYEIISKYVPREVLDELTMDEYGTIIEAWSDASDTTDRKSLGES